MVQTFNLPKRARFLKSTLNKKRSLIILLSLLILLPLIGIFQANGKTTLHAADIVTYPWGNMFYKTSTTQMYEDTSYTNTIVKSLLTDIDDQSKQPIKYPHPILGGNKYWMAYANLGNNGKISYAYSDDLLVWKRFENNPILTSGVGELYVSSPNLFKQGNLYYLFYDVGIPTSSTTETQRLSYASSPTPFGPWTKGPYILDVGALGEWDHGRVTEPGIFKDGDTYYLFYMGDSYPPTGSGEQVAVTTTSVANFPVGPWIKRGIMLPIGQSTTAWDRGLTADPNILKVGTTYYMLYTGSYGNANWKMGIATASNLLGPWTRPSSPNLSPGPSTWDNGSLVRGGLYYNLGKFYLYYSGFGSSTNRFTVGLAIGDPLMTPTPPPHQCTNDIQKYCTLTSVSCPVGTVDDPDGMCGDGFRCCNPNITPVPTSPTPTKTPTPTLPASSPTPTSFPNQQGTIMVNAGGPAYTDSTGNKWVQDYGFIGGQTYSVGNTIKGTTDQALYQSERFGMTGYQFNVNNGSYTVTLKFAEIYSGCYYTGCRVFSVKIEGNPILELTDFDVFAQARDNFKAVDRTVTVTVNDGKLDISFIPKISSPKISAIKIVPNGSISPIPTSASVPTPTYTPIPTFTQTPTPTLPLNSPTPTPTYIPNQQGTIMVNAGGQAYTDLTGGKWLQDFGFIGGQTYSVSNTINGTTDQVLYKSERFGMTGYQFNVQNGTYLVTLKFAEIYAGCYYIGCRVFSVKIEGNPILELTDFDVFAQARDNFKAVDRTVTVTVNDGKLDISFIPKTSSPKISAIKIVPVL